MHMKHSLAIIGIIATMVTAGAQQRGQGPGQWVLRDVAQPNFYLRTPEFVDASKATFLKDTDRVVGITGNGIAKAYPAPAITWHHGIEDHLGNVPIFVTWCNECNTAMVYKAEIDGRAVTFFHTNMVNQNMTFADRETKTRWQQQTGEAIDGPLKGRHLEYLPYLITTWKEWRTQNPKTLVMQPVPGFEEFYAAMWSVIQWRTPDKPGPERIARKDTRLAAYEPVIGIEAGSAHRGYPRELLKKEGVVNDQLGSQPLLVVYTPRSDTVTAFSRTLDGQTLTFTRRAPNGDLTDDQTGSRWNAYGESVGGKLQGKRLTGMFLVPQFWYAWSSFNADTDVYAGKGVPPR